MSKRLRLVCSVLLVTSLLLTPFTPVSAQEKGVETALDVHRGVFATAKLYALAQAGGDQWVDIGLILTADADVSKWVDGLIVRNPVGGITAATGRIKARALGKLAATPGVLSIRPFIVAAEPLRPVPPDGELPVLERGPKGLPRRSGLPLKLERIQGTGTAEPESVSPTSYIGVDVMGASGAWELGYTGQGVIVGQLDDGIDFGHPDLEGTWATVRDPASPYYGWPLIYDPGPALIWVTFGEAFSWHDVWDETYGGRYSYYVDTSYVPEVTISSSGITATAVITTVGFADPPTYRVPAVLSHVYTLPNTSKSGVYHAGIHPESYLSIFSSYGEYVAVLVVDEHVPGVYDTVYVDWDSSYSFDSYERFTKAHPTGWYLDPATRAWSRDVTGDRVADISAGILYWIADGVNLIPGTGVLYRPEYLMPPENGSLVLFYGNYNGNSHGTGTGSAVAARGVLRSGVSATGALIPDWAYVGGGTVWGSAPEAKIFSSNLFSVGTTDYDSWVVQAVGYDGIPGTGDEAQVQTNSWGWTSREDAWMGNYSRILTLLNAFFPYTTWVVGTGNGGPGYGTSSAPGTSPTAITVGGYDLNGTTLYYNEPIAGPDQILFGDLTPYSSKGPNTAGRGDVEIMGIADGATGDLPLLLSIITAHTIDGRLAWYEFGGTSQATPFVAGVAALVAQAYRDANGRWPDYATMKEILMSSATDANNDPFTQGAGRVNARKAVEVAAGLGSFYVSPSQWDAGDYRGGRFPDFAALVAPGVGYVQPFVVHNTGHSTLTLTISDGALTQIGMWETVLTTTVANEEPTRNLSKPDYLVPLYVRGGESVIPAGTELMVVRASTPYDNFSLGDPTIPASMTVDSLWYMKVLNWTDLNHNGLLWDDANANGAVNNGELDNPPSTGDARYDNSSQEINEFNNDYTYGTSKESRVEMPLERAADGLFIGLHHYTSDPRNIGKPIPETPIHICVTFYRHEDVPWLETSEITLTVGAGMTATFVSTLTMPSDQPPGLYEAKIHVFAPDQAASIPVVANVPAVVGPTNLNFSFGGQPPTGSLYDNSVVHGGFDWLGNGWWDQGDWRMYFVDVPENHNFPEGTHWLVDTQWQGATTDIDTLVLSPKMDVYSANYPGLFGPHTLAIRGGSVNTGYTRVDIFGWGRYAYAWHTNTGGPQETVAVPLQAGLNAIELQNVLYDGPACGEMFTGTVGTVSVTPWPITLTSSEPQGTATITFEASIALSGLGYGGSFGLSKPKLYEDQPIEQDDQKIHTINVSNSALLELTLSTKDEASTPDLDLYLFKIIGGQPVQIASSGGPTSDEFIRLVRPGDGLYLARVHGCTVYGVGTYDLLVRNIFGNELSVTGLPTGTVEAGVPYQLTLTFDSAAVTGTYEGLILLGTDKAPAILQVPVEITFIKVVRLPLVMKP